MGPETEDGDEEDGRPGFWTRLIGHALNADESLGVLLLPVEIEVFASQASKAATTSTEKTKKDQSDQSENPLG